MAKKVVRKSPPKAHKVRYSRRSSDRPQSNAQRRIMGTVTGAAFLGFLAFLWQMIHVLDNHTSWPLQMQPPEWAEVARGVLFGCIAFGCAMFADFPAMLANVIGVFSKTKD